MQCNTKSEDLITAVLPQINRENMERTVECFSKLNRASGSPDAETAADYLLEKLAEYGIPHKRLTFTGYLSTAVSASLEMVAPERRVFDVTVCGFSKNVKDLEGEVCYDFMAERGTLSPNESQERFAAFAGKIVLTTEYCSDIALEAAEAGAVGIIGMYKSPEEVPHFFGASNHMGTPTPENCHLLPTLPCVDCTLSAGETIKARLKNGPVRVRMSTCTVTKPTRASIPTAYIPGAEENFVLMDGHYDCHCTGMTDNGAGDAIILELARVFYENRALLKRGILVCWWAGHEFGQYAGSTWYSDTYFEKLRDRCVAHINIDVAGSKGAEQIRARTTQMEGRGFTAKLIEKYTGREALPYIPLPHLGEQSFLGRQIPITVMLKYEAPADKQKYCPVGGGYWWHSREDTLDKVDFDHAIRDARINAEMICRIVNDKDIPVDIPTFLDESEQMLNGIGAHLSPEFDLAPVYPHLEKLKGQVGRLCAAVAAHADTDAILKRVAGMLIQVQFTYSAPYEYDRLNVPATFQKLRAAMDIDRENTDEKTFLFIKTDFLRQRNRLIDEWDRTGELIELQLLRWKTKQ